MNNSYFIFTEKSNQIALERFHICTWEFKNNTALVEFGFEINSKYIVGKDTLAIKLFIPWLKDSNKSITDLYSNLKDSANSKFIFNDSVKATESLDGGNNQKGVIQIFHERNSICILPIKTKSDCVNKVISIEIDLHFYKKITWENKPNIYVRFYLEPELSLLSIRKAGINKSTIIYDIKINERRNLSDELISLSEDMTVCTISTCFYIQIIPNDYDLTFYESSLKNVRVLEFDSFNRFIHDKRVKEDELIVVFNKKSMIENYSFFSIYQKERIGGGQFALAILINLVCGLLIFLASIENGNYILGLPIAVGIALIIMTLTFIYFLYPILTKWWFQIIRVFKQIK